ncbi:ergothioneine biosynthesis protein EgtB [Acidisphaera sp. L21]|uniref:ergothioneine biosynthesis protein EgtB n=1 Tax=Acidisphaera sp. L21 TaxID=1641851 RepID=UPI0020B14812|nr:ergothioneine biosynthesis protein EgtB [Acidisphaera sp. L21]
MDETEIGAFLAVRRHTEAICSNLTPEDQCIQSMPDASPAKWHRAHTTWFFEQFILAPHMDGYKTFSPEFSYLFNSYYETVGARHPRFARGMITRPSTDHVTEYRAHVDAAMAEFIGSGRASSALLALGLQHEQQHQELMMTDVLHAFAQNPLAPAMIPAWCPPSPSTLADEFIVFEGGIVNIGHDSQRFAFDNEGPSHRSLLAPYRLANRLVRNRAWLAFIAAGGYTTPTLWMSEGWAAAQENGWNAPLYWRKTDDRWTVFTPGGERPIDLDEPVRHVSWYEADAFARWSDARLPTEFEWEAASEDPRITEREGHVWQWTASAYLPYPGFRPVAGAIGEYNGKFMINQMVLRGGSMATPPGHTRPTYRNFFHPDRRWQFTGLRLALDL